MLARPRSHAGRARALAACSLVMGSASISAVGCLDRPIARNEPRTTSTIVERLTRSKVDKIDLLLAIDDSGSMADKQEILSLAVPDLVEGLVNPRCINPANPREFTKVDSPNGACPGGMEREFEPVLDIHVGVISSSLGGHGSESCKGGQNEDMARLLTRSPNGGQAAVKTYEDKGFLAWDPGQKLSPPGEAVLDDGGASGLVPTLRSLVKGVGQNGCGYEAQLESWYRFLVDPEPYATIELNEKREAVPKGVDKVLLAQRKAFLRHDSLVAIIQLSDENDCSMIEGGDFYLAAQTTSGRDRFTLARPRKECATDPNDPCCKPCSAPVGACPEDETCRSQGEIARLSETEDLTNLRCFNPKSRFGIDFLHPISRYKDALTLPKIADRSGNLVPNPLLPALDPDNTEPDARGPGLVFYAGIVGVPWQNIARQREDGTPDLRDGVGADGNPIGGFKSAAELREPVAGYASTWDIILGTLGDPNDPPADPHMQESTEPRSGKNPITGTEIAPPGSDDDTNVINGHEWNVPMRPGAGGDLQYACVFPLLKAVTGTSDCKRSDTKNPLCEDAPDGSDTQRQVKAKAYPGLRELALIKELGPQGIVGSVCPGQVDNSESPDFGYRPAIGAIIDTLKTKLSEGQCLPRTLTPDENGQVSCLILEARTEPSGTCDCSGYPARRAVQPEHRAAEKEIAEDPLAAKFGWNCVCEVQQLEGEALKACQDAIPPDPVRTADGQPVNGWCYIDPSIDVGRSEIVATCPSTERRMVRFTNDGKAQLDSTMFITCSGE
jgi:hypothetical protein